MVDLFSIQDLLDQNSGNKKNDSVGGAGLHVNSVDTEKKLQKKIGQVNLKEREVLAERLAIQINYPHINLEQFPVSHEALRQITKEQARNIGVSCFYISQDQIRLGALDPTKEDVQAIFKNLQEKTHTQGVLYVISEHSLEKILKLYDTLPDIKPITKNVEIRAEDLAKVQADVSDFRSLQALLSKASTTDILTFILGAALKVDASDVHVEPEQDKVLVRFRLDGMLHDASEIDSGVYKKLISRIKLVSSLKINITAEPQDGRFTIRLSEGDVDVRVSVMPTVYGESVVMRLLHQSREGLSLDSLGIRGLAYDTLLEEIKKPNGMIITTGPTGSGKTTTLYAVMYLLNQSDVKIITLEDPVEYKMEGVNQSQIDKSKGYTFAKGLRSILRQDPDIAMVGEIRDLETADIAIQAALTGHLMLSTLHTNSAFGAVPRFLSMGVKPFLLAPALNVVMGQRLVRRLCQSCKKEVSLDESYTKKVQEIISTMPEKEKVEASKRGKIFFKSEGCDECHSLGYKGRVGVYEIFPIGDEVEKFILDGQISEYSIRELAIRHGVLTMVQDGIMKALDGMTSLEEVFRVIQ